MYVTSRQGELGVLRIVFEEQYERHLTQLALLARQPGQRGREGTGGDAAAAVTATCRRALAEIGRALRYLKEAATAPASGAMTTSRSNDSRTSRRPGSATRASPNPVVRSNRSCRARAIAVLPPCTSP